MSLGITPEEGACPPENRYVGLIELSFNPTSFFLLTSPRRLILHYSAVPLAPLTPYLLPHTKGEPKRLLVAPPVAERILTHPVTYLRSRVDPCVLTCFL